MTTPKEENRGGYRQGSGRKKTEGTRHMYTVADDVHKWIIQHGGGQYLNQTLRTIMAAYGKEA